jgi:hypothetical protein
MAEKMYHLQSRGTDKKVKVHEVTVKGDGTEVEINGDQSRSQKRRVPSKFWKHI